MRGALPSGGGFGLRKPPSVVSAGGISMKASAIRNTIPSRPPAPTFGGHGLAGTAGPGGGRFGRFSRASGVGMQIDWPVARPLSARARDRVGMRSPRP